MIKHFTVRYSRWSLIAALLPFYPPCAAIIDSYKGNNEISPLHMLVITSPFVLMSLLLLLFFCRTKIQVDGNIINVCGIFTKKQLNVTDISNVELKKTRRGGIHADVNYGINKKFSFHNSMVGFGEMIAYLHKESELKSVSDK